MYLLKRKSALSGGSSGCKGPEAGTEMKVEVVLRDRKAASVAGQLSRGGWGRGVEVADGEGVPLGRGSHW